MTEVMKKKGGRPRKSGPAKVTEKNASDHVAVQEVHTPETKSLNLGGWTTPKAARIKIHNDPDQAYSVPVKLGDSPLIWIRRGEEVIVPYDVVSVLDDSVVDYPMCDMSVDPPRHYVEKRTRFEYSLYETLPWEAWIKFRDTQRGKPLYIERKV